MARYRVENNRGDWVASFHEWRDAKDFADNQRERCEVVKIEDRERLERPKRGYNDRGRDYASNEPRSKGRSRGRY